MTQKTAVITGANSGIGLETAKALSEMGYYVVMTVRNSETASKTMATAKEQCPAFTGEAMLMDLSSFDSVRACASSINDKFDSIDLLINNAGVLPSQGQLTEDGFETQFQVNYLSPVLFTNLLLDNIKRSSAARIVNVSSMTHKGGVINEASWRSVEGYKAIAAYRQSKLALTMFTNELAKHLEGSNVTAFSMHPGAVASNIYREQPKLIRWIAGLFFMSTADSAKTVIHSATSEQLEGKTGLYLHKTKVVKPDPTALNASKLSDLWRKTLPLCGLLALSNA